MSPLTTPTLSAASEVATTVSPRVNSAGGATATVENVGASMSTSARADQAPEATRPRTAQAMSRRFMGSPGWAAGACNGAARAARPTTGQTGHLLVGTWD